MTSDELEEKKIGTIEETSDVEESGRQSKEKSCEEGSPKVKTAFSTAANSTANGKLPSGYFGNINLVHILVVFIEWQVSCHQHSFLHVNSIP